MKDLSNSLLMFCIAFSLMGCLQAPRKKEAPVEAAPVEAVGVQGGTNLRIMRPVEAAKGEVVVLDKMDFLAKVFNYEKNPDKWVYEGDKPCIVDFYADWCGPCKIVSPILKDLARLYKDDIVVYKVDVDAEVELARAFGIQSIPTLLFIPKDGEPQVARGALPREALIEEIDSYLLGKK